MRITHEEPGRRLELVKVRGPFQPSGTGDHPGPDGAPRDAVAGALGHPGARRGARHARPRAERHLGGRRPLHPAERLRRPPPRGALRRSQLRPPGVAPLARARARPLDRRLGARDPRRPHLGSCRERGTAEKGGLASPPDPAAPSGTGIAREDDRPLGRRPRPRRRGRRLRPAPRRGRGAAVLPRDDERGRTLRDRGERGGRPRVRADPCRREPSALRSERRLERGGGRGGDGTPARLRSRDVSGNRAGVVRGTPGGRCASKGAGACRSF